MATSGQIKRIATNPTAYLRFASSGKLPELRKPQGPLFELLSRIYPRDRADILGLVVDARLGYVGSREFRNAEAALRWVAPQPQMVEGEPWPAEAARDKRFAHVLRLEDVLECAASYPATLLDAYPTLRRHVRAPDEAAPAVPHP